MAMQGLIIQPPSDEVEKKEISDFEHNVSSTEKIYITASDGKQIEMPFVISQALVEVIKILSKGDSITLIPMDKELTTQQAADILNVSRPYFVKLLESGDIPHRKTGTHRKILMQDLMGYREKRNQNRKGKLAELSQISQELGLYD